MISLTPKRVNRLLIEPGNQLIGFTRIVDAQIPGKKGFPRFKKHNRSVEYKLTGYQLSDEGRKIKFTDGFKAGEFDLWCSQKTLVYYSEQQIRRVRVRQFKNETHQPQELTKKGSSGTV